MRNLESNLNSLGLQQAQKCQARLVNRRASQKFLRSAPMSFQKVSFVLTTKLSVVGVVATLGDGSYPKSLKERAIIGFFKSFFKILFEIQKLARDLILKEFVMKIFSESILSI